jgi:hypothetical protein
MKWNKTKQKKAVSKSWFIIKKTLDNQYISVKQQKWVEEHCNKKWFIFQNSRSMTESTDEYTWIQMEYIKQISRK